MRTKKLQAPFGFGSVSASNRQLSVCQTETIASAWLPRIVLKASLATNTGWKTLHGASVLSPKYEVFCCDQNGPPARREEGACLNHNLTNDQPTPQPIFTP